MLDVVSLIQLGGYLGLFLIVFAESGLFFGFFLPGDSLLFTAGFLSSQGYFSIAPLTITLFVAAVSGDAVGYFFGKKVGPKLFSRPQSFFFRPSHVDKTTKFFDKYGAKTILLARFIPIVRTFAPIMAGVGGMKYNTFAKFNMLGAFLWAVGLTTLGYVFGQKVPNADQYILPIVVIIIVTSFIPPIWEYLKERKSSKKTTLFS
ncbi:MAG: VTT domain-containing protein [bacterium]|nr:VTT domain-containing protein [bacterium]